MSVLALALVSMSVIMLSNDGTMYGDAFMVPQPIGSTPFVVPNRLSGVAFQRPSMRHGDSSCCGQFGLAAKKKGDEEEEEEAVKEDTATNAFEDMEEMEVEEEEDEDFDDNIMQDDSALLANVELEQLVDLCTQCNLPTDGDKATILQRLRQYALEQAEAQQELQMEHNQFVEEGVGDDAMVKYKILDDENDFRTSMTKKDGEDEEDDDDDVGTFFFHDPFMNVTIPETNGKDNAGNSADSSSSSSSSSSKSTTKRKEPDYITRGTLTSPPVPEDAEVNEKGERVVTVYSSKDQNDLTGVAAAQPQADNRNILESSMDSSDSGDGKAWDVPTKSVATEKELDAAREEVKELIHALLAMTGAPGFRREFSEGVQPYNPSNGKPSAISGQEFVGFDPSKVPGDILVASSKALRAGRGTVLREVLRDYEVRAVGLDGMNADDREKGGGHYVEVSKVRAFLEGFRKAEVRRICRGTATMLLDKVATDGVEGLDMMLGTMTRASDDTGESGELTDSLLEFLSDTIRQQEKKVTQASRRDNGNSASATANRHQGNTEQVRPGEKAPSDPIDDLWTVTEEDGQRMETLDPNDPKVRKALEKELRSEREAGGMQSTPPIPEPAPEKILMLLKLLRDRVKAEAAFANDEDGRNLRILAYCMKFQTDKEREQLILKELRSSLSVSVSLCVNGAVSIVPYVVRCIYCHENLHRTAHSLTGRLLRLFFHCLDSNSSTHSFRFLFVFRSWQTQRLDSFRELVANAIEFAESGSHQMQPSSTALNTEALRRTYAVATDVRSIQTQKTDLGGLAP